MVQENGGKLTQAVEAKLPGQKSDWFLPICQAVTDTAATTRLEHIQENYEA